MRLFFLSFWIGFFGTIHSGLSHRLEREYHMEYENDDDELL